MTVLKNPYIQHPFVVDGSYTTFSHKSLPSNLDVTLDKISFGFMFPLRWETKKYFVVKSRNHQLRPIISHIKYHISPISSNHHQFISPLPPDIWRNFLNIICVVIQGDQKRRGKSNWL